MLTTISYDKMYNHLEEVNIDKQEYIISIIIPVYNEENTIRSILKRLPKNKFIEIIVVDDCSVDGSVSEIKRILKNNNIKLIKHKRNKGYGKAILTGIKYSKGNIIVTMDSDGQHQPEDIYTLIKPILDGEIDLSIGSRYLGSYHYELPISTRLGELLVEKLIEIIFGVKIVNNQGGFRAFDRKILHIFEGIQYINYAFTTELIIRAALYGYRIKEYPIKLLDRKHGSSRIILNKLAINIFSLFFQYFLMKIKMKIYKTNKIEFKKEKFFLREC